VGRLTALVDVHVSSGSGRLPLDTHHTPLVLSALNIHHLLHHPQALVHALAARCVAEVILAAPGMLGSLELLFNPTGLLHSLARALSHFTSLPPGPSPHSPSAMLAHLRLTSTDLATQLADWSLTSLAGWALSVARILRAARQQPRVKPPETQRDLGSSEWVWMRSTTLLRSGLGQSLAFVATPVYDALHLLALTSQALLELSGVREGQARGVQAPEAPASGGLAVLRHCCWPGRLRLALLPHLQEEHFQAHAIVQAITIELEGKFSWAIPFPAILLTTKHIFVLESDTSFVCARLPLITSTFVEEVGESLIISALGAHVWQRDVGNSNTTTKNIHQNNSTESSVILKLFVHLGKEGWLIFLPSLRFAHCC